MRSRIALSMAALIAMAGTVVIAQPAKEKEKAAPGHQNEHAAGHQQHQQQEMPPGMTEADMQACMEAATPGPMHAWLQEGVGEWNGTTKMWMAPGMDPQESTCTSTVTSMMDGRFTKCEIAGEMPGMGPFSGFGLYGFDNVSQKFQCTWADNCGTGMMTGTGELSSDQKTLTWNFTYNCPIAKAPKTMKEIERRISKDAMTLEMYMEDPASGKEFKMMEIAFTRKTATAAAEKSTR